MAGITLADAQAKLDLWMDAEDKVAAGQEYTINGRALKRADLGMIGERVTFWDNKVKRLSRGGIRVMRGVPQG